MPGTYISPAETGLYYLQSRYYDPQVKRFVNADDAGVVTATPASLNDKNLFAYCDNNPVSRVDVGGAFWDTVLDVVSLAFSIKDVIDNPDDPWAWAGLAGDTLDVLVPFVTGVGEITRAVNTSRKITKAADNLHDAGKAAENFVEASHTINKNVGNAQEAVETITKKTKIHGNSLNSPKTNYGYQLLDSQGNIMKYGETIHPDTRYSKNWLEGNGYRMEIMISGSKESVHWWQHQKILDYTYIAGHRPPMNKSFW